MHDNIGDVTLTNISRETNDFMILCSIRNKSSSPFSASICSWHVLNFEAFFQLQILIKILINKSVSYLYGLGSDTNITIFFRIFRAFGDI